MDAVVTKCVWVACTAARQVRQSESPARRRCGDLRLCRGSRRPGQAATQAVHACTVTVGRQCSSRTLQLSPHDTSLRPGSMAGGGGRPRGIAGQLHPPGIWLPSTAPPPGGHPPPGGLVPQPQAQPGRIPCICTHWRSKASPAMSGQKATGAALGALRSAHVRSERRAQWHASPFEVPSIVLLGRQHHPGFPARGPRTSRPSRTRRQSGRCRRQ